MKNGKCLMNDAQRMFLRLALTVLVPLLAVTLGGLMMYQTFTAFFFPVTASGSGEFNGPAAIYYALTFVVALMYFFQKQGLKGFDLIALGLLALVYSLALQNLTPLVHRPIHVYILPQLALFLLLWLVLKYIFMNRMFRTVRLIIFSVLGAAAFTISFWLQYALLHQIREANFLQVRFLSGLFLFVFMGVGLTIVENILLRMDISELKKISNHGSADDSVDTGDNDKTD